MTANLAEAPAEPQVQPLLHEAGENAESPTQGARTPGRRTVAMGAVPLLLGSLGLAVVVGRRPVVSPTQDVGQEAQQKEILLSDQKSHLPSLRPFSGMPMMPTLVPRANCIKLCGLVDPCRATCAHDHLACLRKKVPKAVWRANLAECTNQSSKCQNSCTITHNHDANCLTNCVMSNGKSLSGSLSGYLEQIKHHAKDKFVERVTGRVDDMMDKAWESRDEIIEKVGNTVKDKESRDEIIEKVRNTVKDKVMEKVGNSVKDAAKLAQDRLKNAGSQGIHQIDKIWKDHDQIIKTIPDKVNHFTKVGTGNRQIDGIWKGHDQVMETVRSKAKDAIMMAQDKLKNVDGAKAIEDAIKGQARDQIDKMWKTRSQIIETAGNTAKDIMKDRLEKAVKGHELHEIYKNRDQIMEKVGNKVKDAVKIAVKRRTEDAIEGRVDKIKWTNQGEIIEATRNIVKDVTKKTKHGEIIEATRNMLKDATKKAEDKLKNAHDGAKAIEDAAKGQGHGQMENILKDRDQIIETARNKVKDVTMMAQDKLKKAGDSANAIKDAVKGGSMWKNRDQIIETAGNEAKDVTTMAQDKLKKAGDGAKGIKDDVKGQVDDQIDNVWKNHDEIIDTTQNMVKDVTKVAGARGLKGRVEGQIANLWKNRGKIF